MAAKSVGMALLAVALLAGGRPASAQEPAGPPPPSSKVEDRGTAVLELLPDIGRIGAQAGVMAGLSRNPYGVGSGVQAAGYLDVPLGRVAGGKMSYELLVGCSHGHSDPFVITDPLAYVANLATGASPAAALVGPPGAPFPVRRSVRTRLRVLEVAPFTLKYTVTALDHVRVRPYLSAGADVVVVITRQTPVRDESLLFRGSSPFDGPLLGGLVSQAPDIPTGQGDIEAGFHAGGGVELWLTKALSLAAIARAVAGAGTFARSVAADHVRHRTERERLRRRLKLPVSSPPAAPSKPHVSLAGLREAQQELVHVHAEGLPALGDAGAVDLLAHHMVDGARHLTVIDLWIEAEELRG